MAAEQRNDAGAGGVLPRGRLAFCCLFLSLILCNYLTFGFGMMLPVVGEELGLGDRGVGFLGSLPFLTLLFAQLPFSALAIRIRPKYSMGISFLCLSAGCLLHALASHAAYLAAGRILLALHICSLGGAVQMLKGEWIPPDRVLQVNALQEFSSNLGHLLGTLFAPLLLTVFLTWRRASAFCAALSSAILAVWFCLYRDRGSWRGGRREKIGGSFRLALRRRTVRLLLLGWPGASAVWVAFNNFWPSFALEYSSLDYRAIGMALGMTPIGSVAATLLAVPLARRIPREKLLLSLCGLLLPPLYLATLHSADLPTLCVLFFLAGFCAFAYVPAAMSRLWRLPGITAPVVAAGTSLILLSANVGSAAIGLIYDFLKLYLPSKSALTLCCFSPLLWFAATLFLPPPQEDLPS